MILTKKRRKLAQSIMLFSYIFNISIVSVFVNVFMSTSGTTIQEIKLGFLLTIWNIALIVFLRKFKILKKLVDYLSVKISDFRRKRKDNYVMIYDTFGNKVIAEIEIRNLKKSMKGKTIEEIELKKKYNIQLLVIKRKEEIISEIKPDAKLEENDVVVVFGKMKDIKQVFVRMLEKQEKVAI